MPEDTPLTIGQELSERGIDSNYFDTFYAQLKEQQRLPPCDVVPWEQYKTIVDYLRETNVLTEENKIEEESFRVFDSKQKLEKELEKAIEDIIPDIDTGSSGGLFPCRNRSRLGKSSGGIAPCR